MKYLIVLILCAITLNAATQQAPKLAIDRLALAQSEDGVPLPSDYRVLPGDTVFFSCRVSGYAKRGEEPQKIYLSYEIDAQDPKGVPIIPVEKGKIIADLSPEDREWQPKIRHTIALPPLADSGAYRITVRVQDEFAKASAQGSLTLSVQGREVEPSDTLTVRNFRFLRGEEDAEPLKIAAYRPGDSVWARFDMTGYKLDAKNHFDIDYGLKVLRSNGDTAYEQPKAAAADSESFYAFRYTPGVLNLTLPKDIKKGEYTVILTVHDNLGKQVYETNRKFAIE